MSEINGITFDTIVDQMETDLNTTVSFDGKDKEVKIKIKRLLGYEEAMAFVEDIVAQCTNIERFIYKPEAFDFSVKMNTLVHYGGFAEPVNIENAYSVIYCTDLYEVIRSEIDEEQYIALVSAAKERINNNREVMNGLLSAKLDAALKGEEDK